MFFATDLDRTLIYSNKFLEDSGCEYELVESLEGRPISYMSKRALERVQELSKKMSIVPITTRNLEQYKRIEVFSRFVETELFVVNSGGTIYYKGQEDEYWKNHIQSQIKALTINYEEALDYFLKLYKAPIKHYKQSDELIWLIIGERENIDQEAVEAFRKFGASCGWEIDVNGQKIYLYPHFINKWAALKYIRENYYEGEVLAAGDSLFDYEMVHQADVGFVPKDSYIELDCKGHVNITEHKGLLAAEDIIDHVIAYNEQALDVVNG